jgi:hypothetical protein
MRHLRAIVFDRRVTDHWSSDYLPLVQKIINANISTPTGVSPAQLLFGDAVNLERGILLPHKEVTEGEDIPAAQFSPMLLLTPPRAGRSTPYRAMRSRHIKKQQ